MNRIIALVVVIVVVLFAASSTVFVVDQRHMAVLSGRGDATPELLGPGLHVKLPPPLQTLTLVDSRIQTLDTPDEDRYVTSDKTDLLVDPVIKFRVTDPLKLLAQTKGDDQTLPDRLEHPQFFFRQIGEPKCAARVDQRMLANQIFDIRLRLVIQRIIRGPHIGELRIPPGIDNRPSRQQ